MPGRPGTTREWLWNISRHFNLQHLLRQMTIFNFILGCLACYRLTVLIARDAGPGDIFKSLRGYSKLLSCPYCVSVWIGAVLEGVFYFSGFHDLLIICFAIALAFSAAAIMLDRVFSSDYKT